MEQGILELTGLKGIGEKTAGALNRLGIFSAEDLILYYPRDYETFERPVPIYELTPGRVMCVEGILQRDASISRYNGMTVVNAYISDMTGRLQLSWYNSPFIMNSLKSGRHLIFRGRVMEKNGRIIMNQPRIYDGGSYEEKYSGKIMPVYPLTKGLTNNTVMKAVSEALNLFAKGCEFLPEEILERYGLMPADTALIRMHFPRNNEELESARRRIVFNEFFMQMLAGAMLSTSAGKAVSVYRCRPNLDMIRFMAGLPFGLTKAQSKAYKEIVSDMNSGHVMNRLVEGDVGSGKTVVALLAMVYAVLNGYQAAIMAPTEVLAAQHYSTFAELIRYAAGCGANAGYAGAGSAGGTGDGRTGVGRDAGRDLTESGGKVYAGADVSGERMHSGVRPDVGRDARGNPTESGGRPDADTGMGGSSYGAGPGTDNKKEAGTVPSDKAPDEERGLSSKPLIPSIAAVKIVMLTGSQSSKERKEALSAIADGSAGIIIGTQALFQEGVEYFKLGLIVTDEQHRFGVAQREALMGKGDMPHTLIMSATPIPRTLAMIMYRGMDISVIDARPEGRIPIRNCVVGPGYRRNAYKFIYDEVRKHHQAYIICPAIEPEESGESGKLPVKKAGLPGSPSSTVDRGDNERSKGCAAAAAAGRTGGHTGAAGRAADAVSGSSGAAGNPAGVPAAPENVTEYTVKLRKLFPPEVRIASLHGRMKSEEKDAVMAAFKAHESDILVSTTVVEVGVDVPNATVMMIENAERYGLAQLHQLRGRVGRGRDQSYCIMINTSGTKKAAERLAVVNNSNDGFKIAEADLEMRGPGDIFGTRQSGETEYAAADIYRDRAVLEAARAAADEMAAADPELELMEHQTVRRKLNAYLEKGHVL